MARYSVLIEQGQQQWPLSLSRGVSYFEAFEYVDDVLDPLNIAGYTAKLQIRRTVNSDDPPLLTLTSATGEGIQLDGPNGILLVTMTAAQTLALPELDGINEGWYDLLLTSPAPDGFVDKILSGPVKVVGTVTQT